MCRNTGLLLLVYDKMCHSRSNKIQGGTQIRVEPIHPMTQLNPTYTLPEPD